MDWISSLVGVLLAFLLGLTHRRINYLQDRMVHKDAFEQFEKRLEKLECYIRETLTLVKEVCSERFRHRDD